MDSVSDSNSRCPAELYGQAGDGELPSCEDPEPPGALLSLWMEAVELFWVVLLKTFWADSVTNISLRMFVNIYIYLFPVALVIPDLFAE